MPVCSPPPQMMPSLSLTTSLKTCASYATMTTLVQAQIRPPADSAASGASDMSLHKAPRAPVAKPPADTEKAPPVTQPSDVSTWPSGHPFASRGPSERWQAIFDSESQRASSAHGVAAMDLSDLKELCTELASFVSQPSELISLQSRLRADIDEQVAEHKKRRDSSPSEPAKDSTQRTGCKRRVSSRAPPMDQSNSAPLRPPFRSTISSLLLSSLFALGALGCGLVALGVCQSLAHIMPTTCVALILSAVSAVVFFGCYSSVLLAYTLARRVVQATTSHSRLAKADHFRERAFPLSRGSALSTFYLCSRRDVETHMLSIFSSPYNLICSGFFGLIPLGFKRYILCYFETGTLALQVQVSSERELNASCTCCSSMLIVCRSSTSALTSAWIESQRVSSSISYI